MGYGYHEASIFFDFSPTRVLGKASPISKSDSNDIINIKLDHFPPDFSKEAIKYLSGNAYEVTLFKPRYFFVSWYIIAASFQRNDGIRYLMDTPRQKNS